MLRRLAKLISHPAFRAEPFAVLGRALVWAVWVLLGRSPVFALTKAGERVQVPADLRYTSVATFLLRDWSEPELRRLDLFLQPGAVFVDVGANIGLYALKGARLVGGLGRVIALEPGAEAFTRLNHNLSLNEFPQVETLPVAAGDREGRASLRHVPLGNDPQAYSLLPDPDAPEGETVPTVTLDRLVADRGLTRLDCIKIDVEGFEAQVLAGARETLARLRPVVIFEVNCPILDRLGAAHDEAWRLLADCGYRFRRLSGDRLVEVASFPAEFGNLIALPPDRD